MKFTVIGIGKTGQAMAGYLMSRGYDVVLWDRRREKTDTVKAVGLRVSGEVDGYFRPYATTDLAEAVGDADYVLVMTVAAGHLPVARRLSGSLRAGCRILILNGNWGALEFYAQLRAELLEKRVVLAETGGMPLISDSDEVGTCALKKIKNEMSLAAIPAGDAAPLAEELREVFPFLSPARNVVETSINNTNPILHAPIALLNISRIENGEDYTFYGDAASRLVLDYVERADRERVEIAQRAGAVGQSALEILNSFWPMQHDNLYDAVKGNDTYMAGKGPVDLNYRYITEDVPYGLAPVVRLGRALGVEAPYLEAVVRLYSLLFERDFLREGPCIEADLLEEAVKG